MNEIAIVRHIKPPNSFNLVPIGLTAVISRFSLEIVQLLSQPMRLDHFTVYYYLFI